MRADEKTVKRNSKSVKKTKKIKVNLPFYFDFVRLR